jgi:hypothetical protein
MTVRRIWPVLFLAVFLAGCAAYKELSPDPELLPAERGFTELKNGDEQFTLDKDGKYFVKFPAPPRDNTVLVLHVSNKSVIGSTLTGVFDDGVKPEDRIKDETWNSDTVSVYAVDTKVLTFVWVIDTVKADTRLSMRYRYAPRWRFTFENKYAVYTGTLRDNVVGRRTYEAMGPAFFSETVDLKKERTNLDGATANISALRDELVKLGSLFPAEIVGSRDTAYVSYTKMRAAVDEELKFQTDYATALAFFDREKDSRASMDAFLASAPAFTDFFRQSGGLRKPIVERAKALITARLAHVPAFYENQVRTRTDLRPLGLKPATEPVRKLYGAVGEPYPESLQSLEAFTARFNREAAALVTAKERLAEVPKLLQRNPTWLSDTLYAALLERDAAANAVFIGSELAQFEGQRDYPCVAALDQEVAATTAQIVGYQSIHTRARTVASRILVESWRLAEEQLRELHIAPEANITPLLRVHKDMFVSHLESDLFGRMKAATEQRVEAFITKNLLVTDNVPAMYQDSVFLPALRVTFSSGGPSVVAQRNQQIDAYLAAAKTIRFPETAIKGLYAEFIKNPGSKGAERAKAIVEHGKQYKGDDKQVKAYVAEVDPQVPKWIVRAKDYRKVYALPVTDNPRGTNEYVFRLRLNIPSDAQFPVFDITMKLPPEVAAKAGSEQWYKEITINKKPIKNEGRFRITAPKADNNYESLISPVQMDKDGNNILEVRFMYPGYRVFEVSAMAQVPIIRKN